MALVPGADALWIGTFEDGLARLDRNGRWRTYSESNTKRGLPDDNVRALAFGADGALWIGTEGGGLARLDRDERWQTYDKANTEGGLPDDAVMALAPGADGALWIGTERGLGYFRHPPTPTHRIVDVIGEIGEVTQSTQIVSVVAFDRSYRTKPWSFRYVWRMTELGLLGGNTKS